jgi:hypothetical protein
VMGSLFGVLRLRYRHGSVYLAAHCFPRATVHPLPDDFRYRLINGTGVRFLFGDPELRQHVDDGVGGDLQLPCQLVDSDFTHK